MKHVCMYDTLDAIILYRPMRDLRPATTAASLEVCMHDVALGEWHIPCLFVQVHLSLHAPLYPIRQLNLHLLFDIATTSYLPQLNTKLGNELLPDLLVESVGLFIRKSLLKTAVSDAVAQTLLAGLGVSERVNKRNILNTVPSSVADDFHQVVLVESRTLRGSRLRHLAYCR